MSIWNGSELVTPSRVQCERVTLWRETDPRLSKMLETVRLLMLAGF